MSLYSDSFFYGFESKEKPLILTINDCVEPFELDSLFITRPGHVN